MLWGLTTFLKLLNLTVLHSRGTHARFTARRFLVMCALFPLLFFGQIIHWIGFLLDDVFFRGYRKVEIKDPIFIVGIPRSGTTLLHRVMAEDRDSFTSMKLWEMLIAPSITERKFWVGLSRVDRFFGGHGRRMLVAVDRRLFNRLREIHRMSLFDYDEDELVLVPIFSTVYLFFPFPFRDALWWLIRFDEETPQANKERVMRFYKSCVQRHLYYHGQEKRFLSKNPAFSSKIDAIRTHFPGARVVCNMRSPYETIPSLLSALYVAWDMFDNDLQGDVYRDHILELAGHWYRHPMNRSQEWPDNRFVFLTYDVLRQDLKAAVVDLYSRLGFQIGPSFAERLQMEHERAQAYKSRHQYSLEQYGLMPANILNDFGDIFRRFGFETDYPAVAEAGERDAEASGAHL
jgi:hypothetical protein